MQCYPKVQCNSKEHVNRNIRKDKNADRKAGMVFWPWATNFRSIAHERRISDMEWVHWAVEQQWVCLVIISQIPELSRSKEACNVRIFTLLVTSAGVTIA